MKSIINTFKYLAAAIVALSALGCTAKFPGFNEDPHNASDEQMAVDNKYLVSLFKEMQRNVIPYKWGTDDDKNDGVYQNVVNLNGDIFAGYMNPTNWSGARNDSYVMYDAWTAYMFTNKYTYVMAPFNSIKEFSVGKNIDEALALANIVKIAAMHQVTDYYGPVPYSEAGSLTAAYDPQDVIYTSFLNELDEAITVLENTSATTVLADADIVYQGNVAQWLKFANSLRLRLAIRIAYANPTLAKTEAEKSVASGVIEANVDNAEVRYDPNYEHHPLSEIVKFNQGDTAIGATLDSYMNGYADPRRAAYMTTGSDGNYHGILSGLQPASWTNYNRAGGKVSLPKGENCKIVWMNAAEVAFLRAEGALRGWNMGGTAQNLYNSGITLSFEQWGVSGAANYIASNATPANFADVNNANNKNATSTISIAWSGNNTETNLERIITQKWLALYPNGVEAWAEQRRTGYPKVFDPVKNDSGGVISNSLKPRRLPYPISEQTTNASGYASGVAALGGQDNGATKLWWDKK